MCVCWGDGRYTHATSHTCEVRTTFGTCHNAHVRSGQRSGVSSLPPCFWSPILLQEPMLGLQMRVVKSSFLNFHLGWNSSFSHRPLLPALCNNLMKIFLSPFPKELMEACHLKKWLRWSVLQWWCQIPLSASFRAHSMLGFPLWNSLYLKHPYTVCGVHPDTVVNE